MTTHHQLLSNLTLDSHIYMYIYVLDHGVAQGSMLSPTLSNSVMAQLPPLLSPALYLTIYADLICIWVFGSCLTAVQFHLRDGLHRTELFLCERGMNASPRQSVSPIHQRASTRIS